MDCDDRSSRLSTWVAGVLGASGLLAWLVAGVAVVS